MDKTLIINSIIEHYKFKSDTEFARYLGITPQVLSNWKARNTYDAQLIYTKCLEINPEWLLTGNGHMVKTLDDTKVLPELVVENLRLREENITLKETNDLLRFKVGVLEEKLSTLEFNRPDSTVSKSMASREPELVEKGTKKNTDEKQ
jgi:hypothetical protein